MAGKRSNIMHKGFEPEKSFGPLLETTYTNAAVMQALREKFDEVPMTQLSEALARFVSEGEVRPSIAKVYLDARVLEANSKSERDSTTAIAEKRRQSSLEIALAKLDQSVDLDELVSQIPPAVKRSLDAKEVESPSFALQMNIIVTKGIITEEQSEAYLDWRAARD